MPSPSVAMLVGAAVIGAFASYVWHRRENTGAKALMLMLAAGVVYMVAYALELSSRGIDDKQLWGNLKYFGIGLLPPAWLAFTLQYTGRTRWLRRWLFVGLAVEPVVVLVLLTIPSTERLVHVYPAAVSGEIFPVVTFGAVGWLNVFYSYGLIVFSTGMFVMTLAAIARPYRKQARALIGALMVPFVFNVLYNFNIGPFGRVDLTSFAFFIAVIVLVWGIFRLRLLDILPVARSRIVETMQDGVIVLDAYQRIVDLNPAAQGILGCSASRAVGRSLKELVPEHTGLLDRHGAPVLGQREVRIHVGSSVRHYEVMLSSIPDDRGRESGRLMVLRDISERKLAEVRLEMMAHYDSLTGLPNRKLFIDRLSRAVIQARRHQRLVGLMFLDVDSFKDVNDTLGHEVGDLLLQQLAIRLQGCSRAEDTVARLSGDEFTVIIPEMRSPTDAAVAANRILEALKQPLTPGGHELYISASIGICVWPTDGEDAGALIRNADIAMYRAKVQGRNRLEFYATELGMHAVRRLELEQDLRRALERSELRLHYQPIVSIRGAEVSSMEALVRWQHPKHGLLSPGQFLWCAEETGLIESIGRWVLEESCREAVAWARAMVDPPSVSVNLAARQLGRPGFAEEVEDVLDRTGLQPGRLVLEISEGTVMDDTMKSAGILRDLKALGVGLSLDDFGTGSTSLSQLGRFPLDVLKIDRLFVQDLGRDPQDVIVVQAMVGLAHALGLSVVAEGVETDRQLEILGNMDCDLAQGFLVSRPLPPASITAYMQTRTLVQIAVP